MKRPGDDAMPEYGDTDVRIRSCSEAGAMMALIGYQPHRDE